MPTAKEKKLSLEDFAKGVLFLSPSAEKFVKLVQENPDLQQITVENRLGMPFCPVSEYQSTTNIAMVRKGSSRKRYAIMAIGFVPDDYVFSYFRKEGDYAYSVRHNDIERTVDGAFGTDFRNPTRIYESWLQPGKVKREVVDLNAELAHTLYHEMGLHHGGVVSNSARSDFFCYGVDVFVDQIDPGRVVLVGKPEGKAKVKEVIRSLT